jgi:hypothetical protein
VLQSEPGSASHTQAQTPTPGDARWLSWLLGVALVVAISIVALHLSEA